MNFTNMLRRNIGSIIACLGFMLLCIITFGDLGELFGKQYWINVWRNMTAISFTSIGLTFIQTSIKQGLAEQALQRGLNTEYTKSKYEEHKNTIKENNDKMMYLPYFLQIYNRRHTRLRKREFLINNNYCSEKSLYSSRKKKLIRAYESIIVHITTSSIKWSTVDVIYDKNGQIITLDEHRKRRLRSSMISSFVMMIGVTFVAGGLFFSPTQEALGQKLIKLFTYCVTIAIGSVFTVLKEYEKGAFGVPNDLDEINQIWHEFKIWTVPDWIVKEVKDFDEDDELATEEVRNGQEYKGNSVGRTNIQTEQKARSGVRDNSSDDVVSVSDIDNILSLLNAKK